MNKLINFDEKEHIYRCNGFIVPSVTQIMKPLSDDEYGGIDEAVMRKAAERGSAVHHAIETRINFGFDDIPSEYAGYLEAFMKFFRDYPIENPKTESVVYNEIHQYAGSVDLIATIDGKRMLIDYKTTASVLMKLVSVQLAAYKKAAEQGGEQIDGTAVLHLSKDGTYKFIPNDGEREGWQVFQALNTIYKYKNKK